MENVRVTSPGGSLWVLLPDTFIQSNLQHFNNEKKWMEQNLLATWWWKIISRLLWEVGRAARLLPPLNWCRRTGTSSNNKAELRRAEIKGGSYFLLQNVSCHQTAAMKKEKSRSSGPWDAEKVEKSFSSIPDFFLHLKKVTAKTLERPDPNQPTDAATSTNIYSVAVGAVWKADSPPFWILWRYSLCSFSWASNSFRSFLACPLLSSFPSASCVGKPCRQKQAQSPGLVT